MTQTITLPSGRLLAESYLDRLVELVKGKVITWDPELIRLASGVVSNLYINGRNELTENPTLAEVVLSPLLTRIYDWNQSTSKTPVVIGVPTAGTGLAACLQGIRNGYPIGFRIMRSKKKVRGRHQRWIDGKVDISKHQYITVENTLTTGNSLLKALARMEEDGYPTKDMLHLVLVIRNSQALERARSLGYNVWAAYELQDIIYVIETFDLWPRAQIDAAKREFC